MRVLRFVPVLLAAALVAGCLSPASTPEQKAKQDAANEKAIYDAVEAKIGTPWEKAGQNASSPPEMFLKRLATLNGPDGRAPQPGEGYVETAVKDGYAYLCRTGPDEGIVIFDVHNIEAPKYLSSIKVDAGFEADVEVSDDGHWAFWETQRLPGQGVPDPTDPTAAPGALPYGIHIIDISDKEHPRWAGFTPVAPNGPHSITYARIGGADYIFASVYSWQYVGTSVGLPVLAPPGLQREVIYKLDASGPVAQLTQVATYMDPDANEPNPAMPTGGKMPHDVTISVHPITNKTYAYIAYWDLGVIILDVSDPAHPVKVGAATDFGEAPTREIHMVRQSETLIDGKVVLVAEPEIGPQPTTGYMSMIDATDPAHPTFISNWKIPGDADSAGGGRGPHYFDFKDGRVVMASYSAGTWAFDIHDHANLLQPRTVGYAFVAPSQSGSGTVPVGLPGLGSGSAFDAWWVDPTHVIASETGNGLVVFRYEGPAPDIDQPATTMAPASP